MVICKAHEILRNEAGLLSAAVTEPAPPKAGGASATPQMAVSRQPASRR